MKHLLLLLLIVSFCTVAQSSERSGTVLIHPGETVYARFTQKGVKLKLVTASKEKDEQAQVIVTLDPTDPAKKTPAKMKMVNKFALDLHYKAEIRYLNDGMLMSPATSRVVAGKVAFTELPPMVDAVAFFTFELEK